MTPRSSAVLVPLLLLLAGLWIVPAVPLLAFAALLAGIALDAAARPVIRRGLSRPLALAIVLLAIAALLAVVIGLSADRLTAQAQALSEQLPRALAALRDRIEETEWGRKAVDQLFRAAEQGWSSAAQTAFAVAGGVLGGLGDAAFLLLVGFFLALDPRAPRLALRALVTPADRTRADEVMLAGAGALRGWLGAQLVSMAFVGVSVTAGLMLLGVELALLLGVIAGLFGFIPVIGPIMAAAPALALSAAQGFDMALWVLGLYVVVQVLEGNVVTPLAQSRGADLSPVLLLLAQFGLGALFGLLGIALAAPLAALGQVLVRMIYVEDWLEGGASHPRP